MTREERKPTGLLHSADELKQLIVENPDLPILVFAGDYANNGDYPYMSCSHVSVEKGEFLDEILSANSCYPCKIKDIDKCGYFKKDFDSRCQLCVRNRKLWLESEE